MTSAASGDVPLASGNSLQQPSLVRPPGTSGRSFTEAAGPQLPLRRELAENLDCEDSWLTQLLLRKLLAFHSQRYLSEFRTSAAGLSTFSNSWLEGSSAVLT